MIMFKGLEEFIKADFFMGIIKAHGDDLIWREIY